MSDDSLTTAEIAHNIVETLQPRLTVLLGAGASAAVGIPTMTSFLAHAYGKDFITSIESPGFYRLEGSRTVADVDAGRINLAKRLFQTASLCKPAISLDLEDIFEFIHTARLGSRDTDHATWLSLMNMFLTCRTNAALLNKEYREHYRSLEEQTKTWFSDIRDAIDDLRSRMYDRFLVDFQNDEMMRKARGIYSLFPKVFGGRRQVIFTTNFDTLFEAMHSSGTMTGLCDGTKPIGKIRRFDPKYFLEAKTDTTFLFKMHGSVTWERRGDAIIDTYPNTAKPRTDSIDVAIAEPVISKTPNIAPFQDLYEIFTHSLNASRVCLAIGFSFRDDRLRFLVERRMNDSEFKLITVAPKEERYPQLNTHLAALASRGATWIQGSFGMRETEEKILCAVAENIH